MIQILIFTYKSAIVYRMCYQFAARTILCFIISYSKSYYYAHSDDTSLLFIQCHLILIAPICTVLIRSLSVYTIINLQVVFKLNWFFSLSKKERWIRNTAHKLIKHNNLVVKHEAPYFISLAMHLPGLPPNTLAMAGHHLELSFYILLRQHL